MKEKEVEPSEGWKSHEWFFWKTDSFRCCKKCGAVERRDKQNGKCPGKVRIALRR